MKSSPFRRPAQDLTGAIPNEAGIPSFDQEEGNLLATRKAVTLLASGSDITTAAPGTPGLSRLICIVLLSIPVEPCLVLGPPVLAYANQP